MKFSKIAGLFFFIFNMVCVTALAQENEAPFLKGLKKASDEALQSQQIQLDGEHVPVYNHKRERIRGEALITAFSTGNFIPEFYVDKDEKIQVVVLREATPEEQAAIKAALSGENRALSSGEAPAFSVAALDKSSYNLKDLKGKVVVLNFWFIGCKPCIQEIPELNELVETYKDADVVFIGFALDSTKQLKSFLKKKDFAYTIIPDSNRIAQQYQVSAYPTHIIIDQNSDIVFSTTGVSSSTITSLEKAITSLVE